ncbi:hypothetical protein R1sor_023788 [Riccia sorocarpa]|uniref:Uncharacterized protein n=1 Tax=Riccia sorocarpa TaxID=122646 RepID=A0ABD3GQT5_9MARC
MEIFTFNWFITQLYATRDFKPGTAEFLSSVSTDLIDKAVRNDGIGQEVPVGVGREQPPDLWESALTGLTVFSMNLTTELTLKPVTTEFPSSVSTDLIDKAVRNSLSDKAVRNDGIGQEVPVGVGHEQPPDPWESAVSKDP